MKPRCDGHESLQIYGEAEVNRNVFSLGLKELTASAQSQVLKALFLELKGVLCS